ncbi:MAG TPA: hypothetical protein H9880_00840, partial [Candidatus Anaerobutyricum avicola]|nr:hypothetical protein [Candidatus Anaerobutyricum avicola]
LACISICGVVINRRSAHYASFFRLAEWKRILRHYAENERVSTLASFGRDAHMRGAERFNKRDCARCESDMILCLGKDSHMIAERF